MATFMAIKINYDNRPRLPAHLKYTDQPTREEYEHFLRLFEEKNTGGNGFHESLNFRIIEGEPLRVYIPPSCRPSKDNEKDEFLIFSFTYSTDPHLPFHIVGVHGGARFLCNEDNGIERADVIHYAETNKLCYHVEAPADLSTYFYAPVPYDWRSDRHTPVYKKKWGNGRRYLNGEQFEEEPEFAANIIEDALTQARALLQEPAGIPEFLVDRQIQVLKRIQQRYFGNTPPEGRAEPRNPRPAPNFAGLPDREIGELGERYVYERELKRAVQLGLDQSAVEWVSKADPASPYDIKTARRIEGKIVSFYLEVKSSAALEDNIYVSERQIRFLKQNDGRAAFALVKFFPGQEQPEITEFTLQQLKKKFIFEPIKYKLFKRP